MRSFIATLTAFATLFHLTVGCCGHVFHGDGGHACQHATALEVCDGGHEHGHHHDHQDHAPSSVASDAASVLLAECIHEGHTETPAPECHGCECAATSDARPVDPLPIDILSVAWMAPAIVLIQAESQGTLEVADPPILSEIEPRLFERLLI